MHSPRYKAAREPLRFTNWPDLWEALMIYFERRVFDLTALAILARNPQAPFCSGCGKRVKGCGREAVAVLCMYCLMRSAVPGRKAARPCPDCGEPLAPRTQYCPQCARRRKRESTRQSLRRTRRRRLSRVGV